MPTFATRIEVQRRYPLKRSSTPTPNTYPPLLPGLVLFLSLLWLSLAERFKPRDQETAVLFALTVILFSLFQLLATAYDLYQRRGRPFRLATLPHILWHTAGCSLASLYLYGLGCLFFLGMPHPD